MCYDISFTVNIPALADYFPDLQFDPQMDLNFGMRDHIQGVSVFAPHPVIYKPKEGGVMARGMEWSCIEFYAKSEPDFKKRNGMLNIRAERVLDDVKSYWYKIRNRRCLVPVTGIYEHRGIRGWKKKVPYLVRPAGQEVFFCRGCIRWPSCRIGRRGKC